MTLFSRAPAFVATSALVIGCAVYDSGLTSPLAGGGGSSAGDVPGGSAGTSAGATPTGGGTAPNKAGASGAETGGTAVVAEAGSGDGGDAGSPVSSSGTAGGGAGGTTGTGGGGGTGAGTAGKGGTGGTAGAGVTAGSGGKAGAGGSGGSAGKGGSGGGGGSGGATVKCATHPIPVKSTWIPTAYHTSIGTGVESDGLYNPTAHMIDNDYVERWSSGEAQSARPEVNQEWIQIDFGAETTLTGLTLNLASDPGDFPRAYAVRLSDTPTPAANDVYPYVGDTAQPVRAMGVGAMGNVVVAFPQPYTGRYLTVRQTARNIVAAPWWTITEVIVACVD